MPKLRKIVGPVEDSMPVSRTSREPRERRRHRLIYAYTEAHRLSEGIPTNWQEIPPLIANQPLPEDSFSVIPAALWVFRDRDWKEDPELEYFDDQDRTHPLARVLQGSMTILPAAGDIIAMFEFLEYATGVRWFMVLRRVSVGTDGPLNARDDDELRGSTETLNGMMMMMMMRDPGIQALDILHLVSDLSECHVWQPFEFRALSLLARRFGLSPPVRHPQPLRLLNHNLGHRNASGVLHNNFRACQALPVPTHRST